MKTIDIYNELRDKERETRQKYIDALNSGLIEDAKAYNFELGCYQKAVAEVEKVLMAGKETIDYLRENAIPEK